mmetsp:Transcript_45477/g.89580  ORF Transcript_45477/g.89580 Transcript_45477/m.89580 type:complete len:90 (+) Transcript_45477:659-928(+)
MRACMYVWGRVFLLFSSLLFSCTDGKEGRDGFDDRLRHGARRRERLASNWLIILIHTDRDRQRQAPAGVWESRYLMETCKGSEKAQLGR